MRHLVITIGCEYGAKGNAIGRKIAEDLNIKFYNRELVDEIIEEVGIPKEIMEKVEEGGTIAGNGAEGDVRGSFSKYADLTDRAIHVQKQIIRKLAEKESCVFIGRCADFVLKDRPDVMSVFIHAPQDYCLARGMERNSMTEKEMERFIAKTDKYRGDFYHYYTGRTWNDARNYDLCLDSSKLGFDKCVEAIKAYAKVRFGEDIFE